MIIKESIDVSQLYKDFQEPDIQYDNDESNDEYHTKVISNFIEALNGSNIRHKLESIEEEEDIIVLIFNILGNYVEIELVEDDIGWAANIKDFDKDIYLGDLPEWFDYSFSDRFKRYLRELE